MKSRVYIIDTSAILSGKPINFDNARIVTTEGISKELHPGGRDYRSFQFLIEKGLTLHTPSGGSIEKVKKISKESGDFSRLSEIDIEIIALALDFSTENEVIILSDDYSIQNIADIINIRFESLSQEGIAKRFKWTYRCRGCGKKFKDNIKICPICGAEVKNIVSSKKSIKK